MSGASAGGLDAQMICALLAGVGVLIAPETVRVEPRGDRWAVALPDDQMAWFPMNLAGKRRLAAERRVLDVLAQHCSFRVPRVLHADIAGWQVRGLVPGLCDPWGLYHRVSRDRALSRSIGRALGRVLAQQHALVPAESLAGWLPRRPPWPEPEKRLWDNLTHVGVDTQLLRTIARVLRR